MKLTIMRRGMTDSRASWMLVGAFAGLCPASCTIWLATREAGHPGALVDLLALVLAMWTFGWMLGPVWSGEPVLGPESFALVPLRRRVLALGLLGAALVGIPTGVALIAFGALVVFAARLGVAPVMVAVPVVVLQVLFVVVLSQLTGRALRAVSGSRLGAAVAGLCTAAMLVASQSGWIVFVALDEVLVSGLSPRVSWVIRALPSGWGLAAIDAAGRADWGVVAVDLAGLCVLIVVLFTLWSRSLGPRRRARSGAVRGSRPAMRPGFRGDEATAAVVSREWRAWWRDPLRVQTLVAAPAFAIMSCALPLAFDSTALLPFAGALTAVMGAVTSANPYGQDGTALWLTLLVPGAARRDVRGRALAWMALFGPSSIVLMLGGGVLNDRAGVWPWAVAATLGALAGGVGLMLLVGVEQLVPGPDPRRRKSSPLDHGNVTGQAFVVLIGIGAVTCPGFGVMWVGERVGSASTVGVGAVLCVLVACLSALYCGRRARRTLIARGPELLHLMRTGSNSDTSRAGATSPVGERVGQRHPMVWMCAVLGLIACVPQALVPTIMKINGTIAPVWFLALHLPNNWQWLVIGFMYGLGIMLLGLSGILYRGRLRSF
ncbi:hypothetical protein [Embleya hyalina]|nr:hypothetical protein [Embleya hyalina]